METISTLLPILGILAGMLIAYLTKEELKPGKKYFILLQHLLLAIIIAALFPIRYAIPIAIGLFLLQYLIKYKHPIITMPLLAIIATKTPIPIFLYFIPTGTLNYKEHKKILIVSVFYILLAIISKLF